jgi:hypothetical protein
MTWWVVMLTGPTETPYVYGPFRSEDRAKMYADRWNVKFGPEQDPAEPMLAMAVPIQSVSDLMD